MVAGVGGVVGGAVGVTLEVAPWALAHPLKIPVQRADQRGQHEQHPFRRRSPACVSLAAHARHPSWRCATAARALRDGAPRAGPYGWLGLSRALVTAERARGIAPRDRCLCRVGEPAAKTRSRERARWMANQAAQQWRVEEDDA